MLSFNYDLPADEIINYVKDGWLDDDIKEYLVEISEMNELRRDVNEYFDLTCLSDIENQVYVTVGAPVDEKEYESMSNNEKLLHNEFQLRVLLLLNDIKDKLI